MLRLLLLLLSGYMVSASAQTLPRPDHIVIVVEENRAYGQIIGSPEAPYINELARRGLVLRQSYGVTRPSQPNYLALFSGSTQDVTTNECPQELSGENLATSLLAKGLSFISYAESLPETGFEGCIQGPYERKHNPVANWKNLAAINQSLTEFPQDFNQLPTVALVVPNVINDMHDGTIAQGDTWLAKNIDAYARWAMTHNSLLIVTWDEDDGTVQNHIPTILVGPMVKSGDSSQRVNHYHILRTIEEMFGLPYLGNSAAITAVGGVWQEVPATVTPALDACLFSWAETTYPDYFPLPQSVSASLPPYSYRYYPQSNSYLGTSSADSHLYYKGPLTGTAIRDLGFAIDWYGTARCQ